MSMPLSSVLSPLLRRRERRKKAVPKCLRNENIFMDRNLIPTSLVLAGGIVLWLAIFPAIFRRKASGSPQVFGVLLNRVRDLRQRNFPVCYPHLSAIKARAKLLAAVREKLDKKSFFRNQPPT